MDVSQMPLDQQSVYPPTPEVCCLAYLMPASGSLGGNGFEPGGHPGIGHASATAARS